MTQSISNDGVRFIANFEGWIPSCYNDAAGHCTIGYGHLVHYGATTSTDRKTWGTLTKAKGLSLLRADTFGAATLVRRYIKIPLTQAQFDALVSLAFNCGAAPLTGGVGKAVNAKPMKRWPLNVAPLKRWHAQVAAEIQKWDHAGGKELAGLTRRRAAEARLFNTGKYE